MTGKSASVQNFQHLVKQMINDAREGNDQLVRFRRMISDNFYGEKLPGSPTIEHGGKDAKESESNQPISSVTDISATVAHRRSRRPKYKRSSSKHVQSVCDKDDVERLNVSQVQTHLSHSKKKLAMIDVNEDHFSHLRDAPFALPIPPAANLIEIWSKSPQRLSQLEPNSNIKHNVTGEHPTLNQVFSLSNEKQNDARLSFDAWKKKKTVAYQQIIKKIETEQQQKLLKDMENLEWKKAAHQTRIRKKEQAEYQRRKKPISQKHLEIADPTNATLKSNCNKYGERQDFDRYASKVVNECEEATLDSKKNANVPTTRKSINTPKIQRNKLNSTMGEPMENVTFNSWLNQLNWILHRKYLRERRYLVRSIYCQPFYYGNANFYAR